VPEEDRQTKTSLGGPSYTTQKNIALNLRPPPPKFQEPSLPGPYIYIYIYIYMILVMDFVLLASALLIFNYPTKVASLSLSL
jgi:hypothetical protein